MSGAIQMTQKRPCLFLFDSGAENVAQPALSSFAGLLLRALSKADPTGSIKAELRGGLPLLTGFAAKTSGVSSEPKRSSHTKTHDMGVYKLLLWDMATALSEEASAPSSEKILNLLLQRKEECLAFSDVPGSIVKKINHSLERCPGYVGACRIDKGNPILRYAFYDGLLHLALIDDGCVIQQRTLEGDEWYELKGARGFRPNGLKWVEYSYGPPPKQYQLERTEVSERGALSVDRLKRKTHVTVEGRVLQALTNASWTERGGKSYQFSAIHGEHDVLQAVMSENKFTDYLFNIEHPEGGPKARFIIDELGFDPDDWRFLAAQFYDGLLLSEPREVSLKQWNGRYDARFNTVIEVQSRSGRHGVLKTVWTLEPNQPPRLVTAVPDRSDGGIVKPPTPPVLRPSPRDENWWQELFNLANKYGCTAHRTTIPAPMFVKEFGVVEEGECGSAEIYVGDARRGFARWLIRSENGYRGPRGGAVIPCRLASQSMERAKAYALAFARVLMLNGINSRVETSPM